MRSLPYYKVCWLFQQWLCFRYLTHLTLLLLILLLNYYTLLIICFTGSCSCNFCIAELSLNSAWWKQKLLALFIIMVCLVALVQCFTGSDVLRWRSFYETHDNAWKCHYREVFDNGIRETLCCLGRVKYLYILELLFAYQTSLSIFSLTSCPLITSVGLWWKKMKSIQLQGY